ncbi:MAG: Hsp70 family protein [Desulfosalsimonadaceae bacterium]
MFERQFRYIIGIDLGTTNSAVSYVDLEAENKKNRGIKLFQIPQLTGPGEVKAQSVLPSFCYLPGKYDISGDAVQLPWRDGADSFVGTLARDHGAKVPARLVSSAKSWLCHSQADRRARILPWGAPEEIPRISPVQATAAYLKHIRKAWNYRQGEEDDLYLENQMIILTVPASFDEVARDLTLEAAGLAGLKNPTLLEEPLAAFYSWLIQHEDNWRDYIAPGELVFVCDAGGGTTDFTLITLRETEGSPRFERIAVGDHLILGGDNIDLALAGHIEQRFNNSRPLGSERWKTLCHLCRQAKENILDKEKESETITLMGEGSSLIGGTLSAKMERVSLEQILLEGFFPVVRPESEKRQQPRKGISEFGLPYESEPAITRHIGAFLDKHSEDVRKFLGERSAFPDLILFNGGTLKAGLVQDRIREAIRCWFDAEGSDRPRVLDNPHPDLAVALGASYYGLVKTGAGVRVGSGSPRSYYLGFTRKDGDEAGEKAAICLVERGVDEGTVLSLPDSLNFEVLANQPVSFDLYSSSYRSGDRCGDILPVDETLTPLPPLQTVIQFGQKGKKTSLPVAIEAEYTEMGVLALWCRSMSSSHRWRLQFQLRDTEAETEVADREVFEAERVEEARKCLREIFSKNCRSERISGAAKEVAGIVERQKEKWPLGFIRELADELLGLAASRRYSAEHEIRWLNLTGFCLRPGFGDGMDGQRIKSLWKIYKQAVTFSGNVQARSEWWILWRRVAGGLSAGQQRQVYQDIRPLLLPKKNSRTRLQSQERLEIWMAAANMERLMAKDKTELGRKLVPDLHPKKTKPQYFWALSRIGAREPLYGPVDRVVAADEVSRWIGSLLAVDWKNPAPVCAALAQLARKTGDRARDIEADLQEQVVAYLNRHGREGHVRYVTSVVELEKQDETTVFGESLPSGIVLAARL